MSRIFISHSSANSAAALALASWLESNGWSDYFLDIDDSRGINPGERWMSALVQAVDRCEAVILLVSPAWRDSKYCFAEFFQAKKLGKRIFGVIVEHVALSELPEQMTAEWQICDLTGTHDPLSFTVARVPAVTETVVSFPRAGLEALARGLKRAGLDASTFVWPPEGQPDRSPYPGLRALQEVDAAVFFGRESSIVRAIDQMRVLRERGVEHLFVVLAASGAGKSSFLRAGLLPRLRRDTTHFHVLPTIRPERAAMSGDQGLLNCLKGALETARQPMSHAQIRAQLSSIGLPGLLNRIATAIHGVQEPTLVVPVDQAEELFASDGDDEARQFLVHLEASRQHVPSDKATAGRERRLRVLFVMTIRSDSLPKLQSEQAIQALSPVLFSLPTMPASEFRSVIEGPARRQTESVKPLVITPQLAEQLVEDSQGADALPLLALTLQWLYREFTTAEGTRIGCDEYQQLGGVRGVISMAVRRAFESPGAEPAIPADKHEQERLLKQLFPYIATVDPDTGSWKRRVASREILSGKVPQVDALVSRLVEQRLLLADLRHVAEGGEPVEVVEVAHESLLRQWDHLDHWLRELAADLSAFESLRRSANDWHRSGRDEALLVHTAHRLRAAESLMTDARLDVRFEAIDREYLAACRQRDQREQHEREDQLRRIAEQQAARAALQRRVTWGLSTAAVLLLGLSAWTVMQTREVSLQSSLILTHAAGVAFDQGRFDQGLRLGVLAARTSWLRPAHSDAASELARAAAFNTLRARLDGHIQAVASADFSPDGGRVVTASWDSTARVWDAATGLPLAEPMKHGGAVYSASFSPDGKRVVTASEDSTARVWDVATGRLVAEMKHGGRVYSAEFSLDATRVVTASEDSTARVWDADTGKPLAEPMTHRYGVASARFSHDGKRVVTASLDSTARIWDADTGQPMSQPMEHDGAVTSASFSLDGKRVVTASQDRTARIWDALTGKPLAEPMIHRRFISSASFSRDGKRVVTASSDSTARVWVADSGKPVGEPMKHEGAVRFAAFSPDGKRVITTSEDNTARLWDAETGIPVAEPMKHDNAVVFASFGPDGKRLVTASSDSTARVWDGDLGKPAVETMKQGSHLFSASFSPDGSRVVTASLDSTARIWDARTGKPMAEPMIHEGRVNSASFSPDGRRVITTSEKDMTARIWDADGKRLLPVEIDHGGVRLASFSPDGKRVVTASLDRTVRVWDADTGKPLSHPMVHEARVTFAAFSPDGRRVVTASSGARLWDAETGKPLGEPMTHAERLHSASFSPDGKRVVTASGDSTARVWDAVTGKPVAAPMMHADEVKSASFSPDGKRVVTASVDSTARVWDAETGTPVSVMTHKGGVYSASFSADSKRVVTLSDFSDLSGFTARVWDADSGKPLAEPMRQVFSASFSPDGKRVVTASHGTAGIWDLFWSSLTRTDHLIAEVCRRKLIGRLRQITEADVRMAKILPPSWVGEDVCLGFDTLPN